MMYMLPAVSIGLLGGIFVFGTEAPKELKVFMAILASASVVVLLLFPNLRFFAVLLQVVVSIGILFYLQVNH